MKSRCAWVPENNPNYMKYHDEEWGVPVYDDRTHFEFLILEGAQAGLSWETILNRRDGYKKAFDDFDVQKVAAIQESKIQELLRNPAIIRNELKIRSAVSNAQNFIEIQREYGSFNDYIWRFTDGSPIVNHWKSADELPATSPESDKLSKDLKKRGFKFTGSTIMYAHMQACGLVMDHTRDCFRYEELT